MPTSLPFYKPAPFMYTSIAQRGWRDPTDIMRWSPTGYMSTALDMPGEPIRTYSPYDVRGSSKYPFGKAFKEPWELSGEGSSKTWILIASILLLAGATGFYLFKHIQ